MSQLTLVRPCELLMGHGGDYEIMACDPPITVEFDTPRKLGPNNRITQILFGAGKARHISDQITRGDLGRDIGT